MPETQPKETSRIIPLTVQDYILLQLKDLKEEFRDTRKELNARMDRLENRQDKLEDKIDKLSDKIDKLADKIDSSNKHGNIMTASVIGIALGVLYVIFFK